MNIENLGIFINKDGHGKYLNPDAPKKLIRYITRTNGKDMHDLISWGGAGVLEYSVESVINQFYFTQKSHKRQGAFGRYINHELFSFSPEIEFDILKNNANIDRIARKMARDIFEQDHCQVVYGIHNPDKEEPRLHIHFAINAVNYRTGGKRHENKTETYRRNERFNKIIFDEISGKNMESECF